MTPKRKRIDVLEAQQRAWEAEHVPRADLPRFMFDVLKAVQEEAGTAAFQRVAGRMIGAKVARLEDLTRQSAQRWQP